MIKTFVPISLSLLLVTGCAKTPDRVTSTYVSPTIFDGRSCDELFAEREQIETALDMLVSSQQRASATDAWATGLALVVFWPAAFTLGVTKDNATALSSAKGHFDAISIALQNRNCHSDQTSLTETPEPSPSLLSRDVIFGDL